MGYINIRLADRHQNYNSQQMGGVRERGQTLPAYLPELTGLSRGSQWKTHIQRISGKYY